MRCALVYFLSEEPAIAPVDGVYTLTCRAHSLPSSNDRGTCSATTTAADGTVHTVERLIRVTANLFRREVRQGDVLGKSGKTATRHPHLHYDAISVFGGRWSFFDPALIHPEIANDTRLHNVSGSAPRSPAMRLGLSLTDAIGIERILGIDATSGRIDRSEPCIDGQPLGDPTPLALRGPGVATERSWDLGLCLNKALCTGPRQTTTLALGALSFHEPPTPSNGAARPWLLLPGGMQSKQEIEISCCTDCEDWRYTLTDGGSSTFASGATASKETTWFREFRVTATGWHYEVKTTSKSTGVPANGNEPQRTSVAESTDIHIYDASANTLTRTATSMANNDGTITSTGPTTTVQQCTPSTCKAPLNPGGSPGTPTQPECRGDPPVLVAWDGGSYAWATNWSDSSGTHSNTGSLRCVGCIGRSAAGCSCTPGVVVCN